jgi:hypothetical protein
MKCSLTHGTSIALPYVVLSPGTFSLSATITLVGTIGLIGSGSVKPEVTMSTTGSIFRIGPGADVTFSNLRVRGATGTSGALASGIDCPNSPAGARHVHLIDFDAAQNQYYGVFARQCTIDALRSTFTSNGFDGFSSTDGEAAFERCLASGNTGSGFNLDVGLYHITNSFAFRNGDIGINMYGNTGSTGEFNTVADNTNGGFICGVPNLAYPNNLIVRNGVNTSATCTYPGSLITDVTSGINFKSPDVSPYDYHLMAGSIAIDAAQTSATLGVDYDGDARPQGAGRDVGADEYKP